jgi:recombination protein U
LTNVFEKEFSNSLKAFGFNNKGFWYHRLYDTKSFRNVSEIMCAIKQPGDFIALNQGKFYCIELKYSTNKTSFSINAVADHQEKGLKNVNDSGGTGLLIINNRNRPKRFETFSLKINEWFEIKKEHLNFGRKSIKWDEFKKSGTYLERMPEATWDLNSIFKPELPLQQILHPEYYDSQIQKDVPIHSD